MNNKKDGGLAFPLGSGDERDPMGMSLRDYFESEQTAAWIKALSIRHGQEGYSDEGCIFEAIRLGKLTADAMLEAREK